jgi:hypothetical protein
LFFADKRHFWRDIAIKNGVATADKMKISLGYQEQFLKIL